MRKNIARIASLMCVAVLLTGCGLGESSTTNPTGVKATSDQLAGTTVVVGSKEFDESILLGKMTAYMLRAEGATVVDKTNITGSSNVRRALLSGQIDIYWEYTGTGWIDYLKHTQPFADPTRQYRAVRDEDRTKHGIAWTKPAPMNNTYAVAIRESFARKHHLSTLSDMAAFSRAHHQDATLCTETEFTTRNDGLPGMTRAYDMDLPKVQTMEAGVAYRQLHSGSCNFGIVYATDGRIKELDLRVLEDDRRYFPVYNACAVLRNGTAGQNPAIVRTMNRLAPLLTDEVMRNLNTKVSSQGLPVEKVAKDFLVSKHLIQD